MLHQTNLLDLLDVISFQESEFGIMHSGLPDGQKTVQSGQEVALAKVSARQAKERGLMTSGTYGQRGNGSLVSANLRLSLENRLRRLLTTDGSTLYSMTLKDKVTPAGRIVRRLAASAHRTSDNGCTLLDLLKGWPTTTVTDAVRGEKYNPFARNKTLNMAAQLSTWPTPQAIDGQGSGREGRLKKDGNRDPAKAGSYRRDLKDDALLAGWPTPTVRDWKDTGDLSKSMVRKDGKIRLDCIARVATLCEPARLTASGEMLTGSYAEMESGGQLNPELSLWLMGLPFEWILAAPLQAKAVRKCSKDSATRL